LLLVGFALSGCSDGTPSSAGAQTGVSTKPEDAPGASRTAARPARWYGPEEVERGAGAYAQLCAGCHGDRAQGTFAWRKRGADGKFPPPPLDGTAHAWHHPIRVLDSQIRFGAPGGQGSMPGFSNALSTEQVLEIIAWFQDKWPDEVYAAWHDIELRSRKAAR
jgi:mono/diheme cytochrome c family protein